MNRQEMEKIIKQIDDPKFSFVYKESKKHGNLFVLFYEDEEMGELYIIDEGSLHTYAEFLTDEQKNVVPTYNTQAYVPGPHGGDIDWCYHITQRSLIAGKKTPRNWHKKFTSREHILPVLIGMICVANGENLETKRHNDSQSDVVTLGNRSNVVRDSLHDGKKEFNKIADEKDMAIYACSANAKFMEKLFAENPLIGNKIISDKAITEINRMAKQCINTVIENPMYELPITGDMAITIATINFAKNWDSQDESKFTKYATMQFGYRDDSGNIWRIIGNSIERAMKSKKRFFIVDSNGREFVETVMVHSFAPEYAWDSVFDLLFDFLKNNLRWSYVSEDPSVEKMVEILKRRFEGAAEDDDELIISSTEYRIKLGARRLIKYRPQFAAKLFDHILEQMIACISGSNSPASDYIDNLIYDWYTRKIGRMASEDKKQIRHRETLRGTRDDIAFSYSGIKSSISSENGKVTIHIPAIRLQDEDASELEIKVTSEGKLVTRVYAEVYGNELGKSTSPENIPILASVDVCKLTVSILCDGKEIYSSEKRHWKKIMAFQQGKECSLNALKKGTYEFFVSNPDDLEMEHVTVTETGNEGRYFEAVLKKGYSIKYRGGLVSIDAAQNQAIKVIPPDIITGAMFTDGVDSFEMISYDDSFEVILNEASNLSALGFLINGERMLVDKSTAVDKGNDSYELPLRKLVMPDTLSEFVFIDVASEKVIFKNTFFVANGFSIEFSKPIYFDTNDYKAAFVKCSKGAEERIEHFTKDDEKVSFSYGSDGDIEITIPTFKTEWVGISRVYQGSFIWYEDVCEETELRIKNNTPFVHRLDFGERRLPDNNVQLFDYLKDEKKKATFSKPITITVGENNYTIAHIVFSNMFIMPPVFSMDGNDLIWDGGTTFIGDISGDLELHLLDEESEKYVFPIELGEANITNLDDVNDGDYLYQIIEKTDKGDNILAQDTAYFGNPNRSRFNDTIIQIEEVTEDVEAGTNVIRIKPVYIESIIFKGREFVPSEDGVFDIYEGQMYFKKFDGTKRYYSKREGKKRDYSVYQVNPVKIIYINNRYLRIVNSDDEGLLYYDNFGTIPRAEITDREPPKMARNYKDVLFYIYDVIKTNDKSLVEKEKVWGYENTSDNSIFSKFVVEEQSYVITADVKSRIMVNAGPGTGKTWTLLQRIQYLVENDGVDPEEIIVLCFSRSAVEVVKARLALAAKNGIVSDVINYVDIRTFDSFASQLLYWIKENDPEALKYHEIPKLGYDDRIRVFTEIIENNPDYISQCSHFIVDEVQDLVRNRARMVLAMIRNLPIECGVTLLGDSCQGIYDYQTGNEDRMGSDEFYSVVCEKMKGFQYIAFSRNHRQNDWLAKLGDGYRKAILSCNFKRYNQYWREIATNQIDEFVVPDVKNWMSRDLKKICNKGTVGILTRTNGEALIISACLRQNGINHCLKRRLSMNYLNKWLGLVLNDLDHNSVTYDQFFEAADREEFDFGEHIEEVWQAMQETARTSADIIGVRDLLRGLLMNSSSPLFYEKENEANITVTNIHRGKGKEFETVLIEDSIFKDEDKLIDEHKVDYVAITRPKTSIYKIHIDAAYLNIDKLDRRCFKGSYGYTGTKNLTRFEVGLSYDVDMRSFVKKEGIQDYIRENTDTIIGKKVNLVKSNRRGEYISYRIVMDDDGMILGNTSREFYEALARALRILKRLPSYAPPYYSMFPERITDVYIDDIVSVVEVSDGSELGVRAYGEMVVWNAVTLIGLGVTTY